MSVRSNHRLIEERGQCSPALEERPKQHEDAGASVTLLATPEQVIAIFGNASMWKAVFADMGASLLVVFNGLRLLGLTKKA